MYLRIYFAAYRTFEYPDPTITYLKTCRPEFHTSSFQLQSNFVSCDIPKGSENIAEREFYCHRHMREATRCS